MRRTWSASKCSKDRRARLFGSGAEAGVLRYITNKPKLDVTEGDVNAGYSLTRRRRSEQQRRCGAQPAADPRTRSRCAASIYNDSRGGYINNVPATFTRSGPTRASRTATAAWCRPTASSINNNNLVGNAINPVTYQGFRFSGAVEDQRRLGRAAHADLSEHERPGRVLPDALRLEGMTFNSLGQPIGTHAAARRFGARCSIRPTTRTSSRTPRSRSPARSATSKPSTAAAISCATSTGAGLHELCPRRLRLLTTSAPATRANPRRPASATRRARPGRRPKRTPIRAMNFA